MPVEYHVIREEAFLTSQHYHNNSSAMKYEYMKLCKQPCLSSETLEFILQLPFTFMWRKQHNFHNT